MAEKNIKEKITSNNELILFILYLTGFKQCIKPFFS